MRCNVIQWKFTSILEERTASVFRVRGKCSKWPAGNWQLICFLCYSMRSVEAAYSSKCQWTGAVPHIVTTQKMVWPELLMFQRSLCASWSWRLAGSVLILRTYIVRWLLLVSPWWHWWTCMKGEPMLCPCSMMPSSLQSHVPRSLRCRDQLSGIHVPS